MEKETKEKLEKAGIEAVKAAIVTFIKVILK